MDITRRDMLGIVAKTGLAGVALGSGIAKAADEPLPSFVQGGAKSLMELTAALAKAPRRRDFKEVPMILTKPDQWDN